MKEISLDARILELQKMLIFTVKIFKKALEILGDFLSLNPKNQKSIFKDPSALPKL